MMDQMKIKWYLTVFLLSMASWSVAQPLGVKTNMAAPFFGSLNLGLECSVGKKYSIELYGSCRPWSRGETSVNRGWLIQPEFRYWPCQVFNGHFWGVYVLGAQFNMGGKSFPFDLLPTVKEHRYAGWTVSTGLSYGYQFMLGHHWNVETSLSVGYAYIDYRKYQCPVVCAALEMEANKHYLGPTKLSVSLIYIF